MSDDQAIAEKAFFEKILWKKEKDPVSYDTALETMQQRAASIHTGEAGELLWFLEHPRLYTAGTSAKAEDLINPDGLPTFEAGRGGQWTYHGPGQRIVYVMLDLQRAHGPTPARDLRSFVQSLEKWIMASLASLGIDSRTECGRIGVWTDDPITGLEAKIAAIGIRVSRWVSWHGISINLDPALDDFSGIIPCGIRDYGVTSISRFAPGLTMSDLDEALLRHWPQFFGAIPCADTSEN
ncbi:lipoyl(octanoyl) transferase LipB [Asaia lannensis]|uniref:Octanoyltransferase n=1 Tax=Asaia lannensis NBRC 102526 TaxID=1307926 RepID=A0ABT1CFM2_9PROT|nr:lipoyl(octanoyl) transferase LipB [Asaia lannensis]MCO6159546.1 lipoyl(octanoyl) transferase LipB [Asaia lannensis NBRC 102526]GBQ98629.1 lipoate-protein ligase B [Asaia lannensis NBRC 102526]